jgi:hypothetical protein
MCQITGVGQSRHGKGLIVRYSLLDLNGALILGVGLGMLACFSLEFFLDIPAGGALIGIIAAATVGVGSVYSSSMRSRARDRARRETRDAVPPAAGGGKTAE